jgi:hypothetical protein
MESNYPRKRHAVQAAEDAVTDFWPVAVQSVVTGEVVRDVVTAISALVAAVVGAVDQIVQIFQGPLFAVAGRDGNRLQGVS